MQGPRPRGRRPLGRTFHASSQQLPFKNSIAINLHYTDELKSVVFFDAPKAFSDTSEKTLVDSSLRFHNKKTSLRVKSIKPLSIAMEISLLNEPVEQNSAPSFSKSGAEGGRCVGASPQHEPPSGTSVVGMSFFFFSCHVTVKKARLDLKMYQWFLISYDEVKERRRKCLLDYF